MEDIGMNRRKSVRKTVVLAVINLGAAAAVGIMAGLIYKPLHEGRNDGLEGRIESLLDTVDAHAGVAVVSDSGDTVSVIKGGGNRFAMMIVVKFHQALAVCRWLRDSRIPLDEKVHVRAEDLRGDTYSPLRDRYREGGYFSFGELLEYTLAYSDNNACDILFGITGGPRYVQEYVQSLGICDSGIECTEADMHADPGNCYRNWSSPLSSALLCDWFYGCRDVDEYSRFVWDTMTGCATGKSRIPRYISGKVDAIAHKTGTGDISEDGRIMAVNDVGIVVMPDGRHFSIAVFIEDASCTMAECEELIAGVTALVCDWFSGR